MALPRSLAIDVYVVGQENALDDDFSVTTTYVAASSTPPMPGLVDVTGTIDLDLITFKSRGDPKYDMAISTVFTLKPFIFDRSGNPVQAIFATPTDGSGIVLVNPKGKWPKKENMFAKPINDVKIVLYNKNTFHGGLKKERTYSYALGIFLIRCGQPNYFISLETLLETRPPV